MLTYKVAEVSEVSNFLDFTEVHYIFNFKCQEQHMLTYKVAEVSEVSNFLDFTEVHYIFTFFNFYCLL